MTNDQELDHFLRRHNAGAIGQAAIAAVVALVSWPLVPVGVSLGYSLYAYLFMAEVRYPPELLWVLVYPALNVVVLLWRVGRGEAFNCDMRIGFLNFLFWPAYLTAEVVAQWRRIERLSPAERAAAQSLMLRAHRAGPDGFLHRIGAAEQPLVDKLEAIGALRVVVTLGDAVRIVRRDPDSSQAIPVACTAQDLPPLGLVAGGGDLPLLEAQGMRKAGRRIAGIGMRGQYDPAFPAMCDTFAEISVLRPGSWARHLRRQGAFEAVMVGYVRKERMYNPWEVLRHFPDFTILRLFLRRRHDLRSQGLLSTLADLLKEQGLLLVSTTEHIPDHLATHGPMTRRRPGDAELRDIQFALPLLRELNALDIGQGLCVKGGDVIALEAMEGTDRMIARAGELCRRGGWTLVKGADSKKDLRFDVPTVGVATIENLKKAGASCLAVVAGRTIFVDKPAVLAAADKAGIAVFGVELE